MREWLTIIIALLILAVVLDGLRRMRQARRGAIRMSAKISSGSKHSEAEGYGSELPNGGARVVNVRQTEDAQQLYEKIRQTREEKKRRLGRPNRIPQQVALNLDEHVPTLMEVEQETVAATAAPKAAVTKTAAPENTAATSRAKPQKASAATADDFDLLDGDRIEPSLSESDLAFDDDASKLQEAPLAEVHEPDPLFSDSELAYEEEEGDEARYEDPADDDYDEQDEEEEYREPELVLVINVMAPKGERFIGAALLDTVLEQGMRFGSMNIFHHHANNSGKGAVLYSMANIVVPGTFDLAAMKEDFTTPGVSLFLALPVDADSSDAFESMLSTARAIADTLGGELKDENRSVMTTQTIEHYRSRIKEFERKQLSRHV